MVPAMRGELEPWALAYLRQGVRAAAPRDGEYRGPEPRLVLVEAVEQPKRARGVVVGVVVQVHDDALHRASSFHATAPFALMSSAAQHSTRPKPARCRSPFSPL